MSNLDDVILRGSGIRRALDRAGGQPEPVQVEIVTRSDVASVIANYLTMLTNAWLFMLFLGALSHRYPIPAPSYVDSLFTLWVLAFVGYGLRGTHRVWIKEQKK